MASLTSVQGYFVTAPHFYLFSAEGRVYRAYDRLEVPGGNPSLFDFYAAEQRDPENSGHYSVRNGEIYIEMDGQKPESFTASMPSDGSLSIYTVLYSRR